MFNKLVAEINRDADKQPEVADVEMTQFVDKPEVLISHLKSIEAMSDSEAFDLIRKNYTRILSDNRFNFIRHNHRFITLLTQVTYEVNLTSEERIYCNSLIHNYLVYQNEQDKYLKKLLLILGEAINKPSVNKLLGQDINQELAIFLAVCSYSTANAEVNTKRFNFALAVNSEKTLSLQKIINIYTAMYRTSFSSLLISVVFDTTIKEATENAELWVTKEAIETNDNITWAVLHILESLPAYDISKYLYMVSESFKVSYDCDISRVRMTFHNLPARVFHKIPVLIEQMEGSEQNIIIP